jgi:streptogramin lyase
VLVGAPKLLALPNGEASSIEFEFGAFGLLPPPNGLVVVFDPPKGLDVPPGVCCEPNGLLFVFELLPPLNVAPEAG